MWEMGSSEHFRQKLDQHEQQTLINQNAYNEIYLFHVENMDEQ